MKKIWKIIGIIAAVLVVLIGGLLAWLSWEGSPKEIVSVADEFKPGASWELVREEIIPPRNSCIDVHCPHVHREWQSEEPMTLEAIREILKKAGWSKVAVSGSCNWDQQRDGKGHCSAEGDVTSNYGVQIYIENDKSKEHSGHVTLFVDYKNRV